MKKFLFLLSLFVFVLSLTVGQAEAGKDDVEKKLSATLRRQMAEKNDYSAKPTAEKLKALKKTGVQEMESQIVFLHFKKEPNERQLRALARLGVEIFDRSWIPPVKGKHPTGFVSAKIPIGVIRKVARKSFIQRIETAEQVLTPSNDSAAEAIRANTPSVWGAGHNGSGVKIAVLDSGLDTTHPDIPEPIIGEDYSLYPAIDKDIANRVTGHGTHVAASALGRGVLSNGKYKGIAYGADLIFLKIGDDDDAATTFFVMAAAIKAAADYGADVINASYGGFDPYKDGSDEICQAVDEARSRGVLVFSASGNEGDKKRHYSATLDPGKTDCAEFKTIVGGYLDFDINWVDGIGVNNNLSFKIFDVNGNDVTNNFHSFQGDESPRGTELITTFGDLPEGTYYIHVTNNSGCEQMFHIYSLTPWVTFAKADPMYTIQTPALADGAVAVGSWVTRILWTNYLGQFFDFGGIIGTVSGFSSQGPRIDGLLKPYFVSPGEWVISARDKIQVLGGADYLIIDNDGVNDGNGPADYMTLQGTSMSSPIAAGAAAVLISANPGGLKGNPDALLQIMRETASNGLNWSPDSGYGLINLETALERIEIPTPTPDGSPTPEPTPTPEVGGGGGDEPKPKDVFEIRSTNPKDGAVDVETDVEIILVYNQSICSDPEYTLNESGVELRVEGTETNLPVDVSVAPYPNNKKLQIVPLESLNLGTVYTLKVPWNTAKAANAGGTQMVSDFKMKFTTIAETE